MKTSLPKETIVELLYYIAENEKFSSVTDKLKGAFTSAQVRSVLRELAESLSMEAAEESRVALHEVRASSGFSSNVQNVISSLSPHEEQRLFSAFGLISK
ncbi:MAG: hypothetical protein ABH871_05095 [Pseudomonadota bacterium]